MGIFKKSLLFGVGILTLTREKAEKVVHDMVERGEVGAEEAKTFVNELMEKGEIEKAAVQETVKKEVEDLRKRFGLITRAEFEMLEERIKELESKLNEAKQ
jgi:polyhydroxyalkanoate synthesis regulator phasin